MDSQTLAQSQFDAIGGITNIDDQMLDGMIFSYTLVSHAFDLLAERMESVDAYSPEEIHCFKVLRKERDDYSAFIVAEKSRRVGSGFDARHYPGKWRIS